MSGNEPITLATVREYMLRNDSKVKNHDLVTHFRQQLNDPVNKGTVRTDFKEIVHQLATVQTINEEKYFVLKRPKEAPAVLRKPTRPHPSHKPRPASGPPVLRNTKMFEDMLTHQLSRSQSTGDSANDLASADKENRSTEARGGADRPMMKASSVDSVDSTGSGTSTPQQGRKVFQSGKGSETADKISQSSADDTCMWLDDQELEGDDLMSGPTIQLEPIEKEWMLTAARGNRAHIMCLLEQEPGLAKKKDFTTGYTALHWAAKHGREDIAAMLAKAGVEVNAKTHGGYTALHLASMHGHDKVIKILVDEFNADISVRDHSGRKPRQVAKDTLTIEAQRRLEHVLITISDSSSESGYGSYSLGTAHQVPKQYGSLNSIVSPSAALLGYYSNESKKQQPQETPPDKHRDRSSSFGKFLSKKKHKKERLPTPSAPYGGAAASSAGLLIGSPMELQKMKDERRENELDMKRTQSDPSILSSEI